jgi:hypothetical protein
MRTILVFAAGGDMINITEDFAGASGVVIVFSEKTGIEKKI